MDTTRVELLVWQSNKQLLPSVQGSELDYERSHLKIQALHNLGFTNKLSNIKITEGCKTLKYQL